MVVLGGGAVSYARGTPVASDAARAVRTGDVQSDAARPSRRILKYTS